MIIESYERLAKRSQNKRNLPKSLVHTYGVVVSRIFADRLRVSVELVCVEIPTEEDVLVLKF